MKYEVEMKRKPRTWVAGGKHTRRCFKVTLELPPGVTEGDMVDYLMELVTMEVAGNEFTINPETVRVKWR